MHVSPEARCVEGTTMRGEVMRPYAWRPWGGPEVVSLRSDISCGIGDWPRGVEPHVRNVLILVFVLTLAGWTQERAVDPTRLHRYVPTLSEVKTDLTTGTCHYKPIFGEGDADKRILQTVVRFGEVTVDAHGSCGSVSYERQEELYLVLEGQGSLALGEGTQSLRARDFTYLAPGVKHSFANSSEKPLRV